MPFLPVAERELRVASRRSRTYWGRFGLALGAILVAGYAWLQLEFGGVAANRAGTILFGTLAGAAFVYCLGVGMFAVDSISHEKREGTLGFLFLTDLRGYDVVTGKLLASSIHGVLGLLAAVPVLAMALLVGGVSGRLLGRVVLVLLSVLLLSLAAGLLVSTLSRDSRKAASGLALVLLLLTFGLPLLGYIDAEVIRKVPPDQHRPIFYVPSPLFAIVSCFAGGMPWSGVPRDPFWWSIGSLQVLAWGFLGTAALLVPRVWQERGVVGPRRSWQRAWHWVIYGAAEDQHRRRSRLLDLNAVCWLSSRERWKGPAIWGVMALVGAGWGYGYYKVGRGWLDAGIGIAFALILHGVFKYWLASESCRRFAEDRQSGALELVLSTSMGVRGILRGQWLALHRIFLVPWVAILVIDAMLLWAASRYVGWSEPGRRDLALTFFAGMAVLVVHYVALGWVGMWRGLSARSLNRAVSLTVTHVMVLPWLIYWMLMAGFTFVFGVLLRSGPTFRIGYTQMLAVWFVLMVSLNVGAALWARRALRRRFREIAMDRFDARERRGFLGLWRGKRGIP